MPQLKLGVNSYRQLAILICGLLCVLIWAFTFNRIDGARAQAIAGQLASNSVLAQTQEGRISNGLHVFDQILLVLRDDFQTRGKPPSLNQRLKALQVDRTYVGIVTLINEYGDVNG